MYNSFKNKILLFQLDVVAFANLAQLYFLDKEVECQLRDYLVDNFENLVAHTNRIKERCFPDWDDMCKNLDLNSHLPKPPPVEEKPKDDGEKKVVENKTNEKEALKESEEKVSEIIFSDKHNNLLF